MTFLWILLPSPFVGYLIADSVRKIFSEDDRLLWRIFKGQPVTMLAASTALGSVFVWSIWQVALRVIQASQ